MAMRQTPWARRSGSVSAPGRRGCLQGSGRGEVWASVPHAVYGDQGIHGHPLRQPGRWHAVVLASISLLASRFLPSAANRLLPRHVL